MSDTETKTVLVVGATGFLGPALVEEFAVAGFRVICGVRSPDKAARQCGLPADQCIIIDCNEDLDVGTWLRRLRECAPDVVVNNVGIANCFGSQSLENVNVRAPLALFEAVRLYRTEKMLSGPPREYLPVVQISTTGVGWPDFERFAYPLTKMMMEEALAAMDELDWIIVRPNVIFEPGRGHLLLERIASFPLVFYIGRAHIQPIHCRELSVGVVRLVRNISASRHHVFTAAGPEALTWKEIFQQSKRALNKHWGIFLPAPLKLAQLFTMLVQHLPEGILRQLGIFAKMDPETMVMMTRGSEADNRQWLRYTGVRSLRLFESYDAYGQGPEVYGEFIRRLREEYLTDGKEIIKEA